MIYLDHAATTPIHKKVCQAMDKCAFSTFGNPSSIYSIGRQAKKELLNSKKQIASIIEANPKEIIFTSGGTESNNLAIFGIANNFLDHAHKYHLITSVIEHPSVLNCFKKLESLGFQIDYLPVNKYGIVDPRDILQKLKPNTVLVSIMYVNNEIGTIQPIKKIAGTIRNYRHIQQVDKISKNPIYPIFHTDACQAAGYLDINADKLGVDLMTINSSKIYGPKGVGLLYKKNNIKLSPLFYGGQQEYNYRPGTENVAGIVGLKTALAIAEQSKEKENKKLLKLRDYFTMELLKIPTTILNGHPEKRLPNNINISFSGIEGESVILMLDKKGICASTGSACHSDSLEPSHVIMAIGADPKTAHSSIRFTMGKSTTKKEIDTVLIEIKKIVNKLRDISAI